MSFANLLIHTCTVQRYTEGAQDDYGNPILTWDLTYIEDEPCRLTASSGKEIKVGAEIVIADYKLFLDTVDITEQDRVVISGDTYEILSVQDYADSSASHHKQAWLRISR